MKYMVTYINFLNLFLFFCSCNTVKKIEGIETEQFKSNCFSDNDLREVIILKFSDKEEKPSNLFIEPIIVNNCIGLYGITFKNITSTYTIIQKTLKFDDKVYLFSSNNLPANKKALNEFTEKCKTRFTKQELDKLIESFNKGTESNVRYY